MERKKTIVLEKESATFCAALETGRIAKLKINEKKTMQVRKKIAKRNSIEIEILYN